MKAKLFITFLIAVTLLYSCERKIGGCAETCYDIEKPANLKPIDWNGWNDAYTVFCTFYDNEEDACYDHVGDTIMCYGHVPEYWYASPYGDFRLEVQGGADNLQILFNLHGSEIDSLHFLLNNSSHTDTCFVKGILGLFDYDIQCCMIVQPTITVNKIEDFYFKQ